MELLSPYREITLIEQTVARMWLSDVFACGDHDSLCKLRIMPALAAVKTGHISQYTPVLIELFKLHNFYFDEKYIDAMISITDWKRAADVSLEQVFECRGHATADYFVANARVFAYLASHGKYAICIDGVSMESQLALFAAMRK